MILSDAYTKFNSYKKRSHKFRRLFPDACVINRTRIYNDMERIQTIIYILDTEHAEDTLNEEKAGKTSAALVKSPSKSLARTAQQTGMSAPPASSGAC